MAGDCADDLPNRSVMPRNHTVLAAADGLILIKCIDYLVPFQLWAPADGDDENLYLCGFRLETSARWWFERRTNDDRSCDRLF